MFYMMKNRILLFSLVLAFASAAVGAMTVIPIEKGEHWWGGAWDLGGDMPLDDTSDYVMDLREGCKFQGNASLFVSDRGRWVWSDDPCEYVRAAISPAVAVSVTQVPGQKACRVLVPDDQLSLAIGKEGQNARLAARLTGYKIDIKPVSQAQELPEEEQQEEE